MAKRTATEIQSTFQDGQPFQKATATGAKRDHPYNDEMGEFEDAWEDELESDEENVGRDSETGDGPYDD